MAKILGLDLGTASIGWAVLETNSSGDPVGISGAGSRVIPADADMINNFSKGKDCSANADRTTKRTMRKMNHRFKMRRDAILEEFRRLGVDLEHVNGPKTPVEKWKLRADAVNEQIPLASLAEVLLHINSRRGYNASKADLAENDTKKKGYVSEVRGRYAELHGDTPGEFFYSKLAVDPNFRVKGEVLPRQAYRDEAEKILQCQSKFYPDVLTAEVRNRILDYILFYQRPLKSCKHLVSDCELEKREIVVDGEKRTKGPKVAHVSNPLFQVSRIWQVVNNISFTNREEVMKPDLQQKEAIAQQLLLGNDLKVSGIKQLCGMKPTDKKWRISENASKGIKGNATRKVLAEILGNKYRHLCEFEMNVIEIVDEQTGEVKGVEVSDEVFNQPLYRLWHAIYSISSLDDLGRTLRSQFGIEEKSIIERLCSIDFQKQGYGSLSAKALRKILPHLMRGHVYSEACALAGYNHSHSVTREENETRELMTSLPLLPNGEMRQPVVEKILNQMINLVNALMEKYGRFDSIRIEMARELKMGKEERDSMTKGIAKNERENDKIRERIKEHGLFPTLSRVTKMKLWEESSQRCMYCGDNVGIAEFLVGVDSEVEHIIPKSLLFDDSYANKVCACRTCNQAKGQMTAIDFMRSCGQKKLAAYIDRISALRDSGAISGRKYKYLMMPKEEIPEDFIARDLKETQFITRKALEMLHMVSRDVMATSGKVTDYIRRQWGWDTLLHEMDLPMYQEAGLTVDDNPRHETRIKDWSKRLDHRHHALDAIAIASTTRSLVSQLNHLNTLQEVCPGATVERERGEKKSRLERYIASLPHLSRAQVFEALGSIAVSMKPKSKLTTPGKVIKHTGNGRKTVQTGLTIPRGPLHKETIYGKIKRYDQKTGELKEVSVVRYPLSQITRDKDAEYIVDGRIRKIVKERLAQFGGDAKKAFAEPLYSDKEGKQIIKSVRCFANLSNLIPVRRDADGREIGFAAAGSNHHVALYRDKDGKIKENVATFDHCVKRKLAGIDVVIKSPADVWTKILNSPDEYTEDFQNQLPEDGLTYWMHMQINEMFILGLDDATFAKAIESGDQKLLAQHLYRVQKLSKKDYTLTFHTVTISGPDKYRHGDRRFLRITSLDKFEQLNPKKVKVTNLGEILPL